MRVAKFLETDPEAKLSQLQIAELLGVSPRTIYNWRRQAKKEKPAKIGRPTYGTQLRRRALWAVGRELIRQKYPGWRAVKAALHGTIPDRLIQQYVGLFKARKRRTTERIRQRRCAHVTVKYPDVIWSMDTAHLAPCIDEPRPEAQVARDRASRSFVATSVGPPVTGRCVIDFLESARQTRGTLPLVLSTDNGAPFVCEAVKKYLEHNKVIHLRSLPRTPQHNGAVELGIRELKDQLKDLDRREPQRLELLQRQLGQAASSLNNNRRRARLAYLTATKFDSIYSVGYNQVRESFYRECCKRIEDYVLKANTARAEKMAKREAIYASLEIMGWIKRWSGGLPKQTIRPENIS